MPHVGRAGTQRIDVVVSLDGMRIDIHSPRFCLEGGPIRPRLLEARVPRVNVFEVQSPQGEVRSDRLPLTHYCVLGCL